jgi:hypothetical protein
MSTCEVRLFVPKGYFTAYVSGMTIVDEIFCSSLYSILFLLQIILVDSNLAPNNVCVLLKITVKTATVFQNIKLTNQRC